MFLHPGQAGQESPEINYRLAGWHVWKFLTSCRFVTTARPGIVGLRLFSHIPYNGRQ
jgi:hypothetical protein